MMGNFLKACFFKIIIIKGGKGILLCYVKEKKRHCHDLINAQNSI